MNYPRISCYSSNSGGGGPLLNNDFTINTDLVTKLARYPTVTLNITPWYAAEMPSRADVILLMRKTNPKIRILAYQLCTWWYLAPTFTPNPSDKTFAATWHDAILATNGFGAASGSGWWVRWDRPEVEAKLTQVLCDVATSGLFDGFFLDYLWGPNSTVLNPALERLVHALKRAGGPCFTVHGNGGDAINCHGFREGFPDHLGHNFEAIRTWRAARPHKGEDWLQAGTGHRNLDTPDSQRAARFAHGTACLFDMLCSFGPDRDGTVKPSYMGWWMTEYDGAGRGTGWLGEPMGPATVSSGTWKRLFGGGYVVVNTGSGAANTTIPKDLVGLDGTEVGTTLTVPAKDAVFLARAR